MPGSVGQSVHLFMTSKACLMAFSHLKRKSRANVGQGAFPQTWEGWEWLELCNIFQPWTFRILQQLFWLDKAKRLSIITVIPILPMSAGMQHHNQHLLSPHHQSRTSYGSLKSDAWCKNERRGTMISQWSHASQRGQHAHRSVNPACIEKSLYLVALVASHMSGLRGWLGDHPTHPQCHIDLSDTCLCKLKSWEAQVLLLSDPRQFVWRSLLMQKGCEAFFCASCIIKEEVQDLWPWTLFFLSAII